MKKSAKITGSIFFICLGGLLFRGPAQASLKDLDDDSSKKVVRVLSLDGGGVRGLIPLTMLSELEKRLGKSIAESFDVIAGTSTGGIIALSLTAPDPERPDQPLHNASDLLDFYAKEGAQIFGRENKNWLSCGGVLRPRYSARGAESLSKALLGETALSGALSNVLVTSYDISRDTPLLFESSKAQADPGEDYYMRDVAVGTAAAPTYFPPKVIQSFYGQPSCVVDGGVVLNNPSVCAYAAAKELYPQAQEMIFVSLGTGKSMHCLESDEMTDAGTLKWVKPMLSMALGGTGLVADEQMRKLLPDVQAPSGETKQRYFRFQPTLPHGLTALDNVKPDHVKALITAGKRSILENETALDALVSALRESEKPLASQAA